MVEPGDARLLTRIFAGGFRERYPHYGYVLARLTPLADSSILAMAVGARAGGLYLHVNPGFFASQPKYLDGILLHEIHHIVLGHLTEPRFRAVETAD